MLEGKSILITGASKGLGKALSIALSRLNVKLILCARNLKDLELLKGELKNSDQHLIVPLDISDPKSIKSAFESLNTQLSSIDVLINNAASWLPPRSFEELSDQDIIDIMQTNAQGTVLVTKNALGLLSKSKRAHIINVTSKGALAHHVDSNSTCAYAASKWALMGFSELLIYELKKKKIAVTNLIPGAFANESSIDTSEEEMEEKYKGLISLKDLVDSVVFILSRRSSSFVRSITIDNADL